MSRYNLIDSTIADESDTEGASSDLETAGLKSRSESDDRKSDQYNDYYEHVARSEHIRPIAVTEDVNFETMSSSQTLCWWMSTAVRLLSCIVLSVRTDRLWDPVYLARHYRHYGLLLLFALLAWSPQVLDTLGVVSFSLDNVTAFIICVAGNLYYFTSISVFFRHVGPWLRRRWGVANTLRFWEFYVSLAWQGQTIAFWALTITPAMFEDELKPIPTWLTTSIGLTLIILGIGSKMGAIYGTGYNTYYWYDMVTDIPNAYFVQVGIYNWVESPTYTLGRGTSFGAALHYRSVPMLVAAIIDLAGINLFNHYVEQPSVRKMYGS